MAQFSEFRRKKAIAGCARHSSGRRTLGHRALQMEHSRIRQGLGGDCFYPVAELHDAKACHPGTSTSACAVARRGSDRQTVRKVADAGHHRICVAQSLLPFLWRDGHLGGRQFSVLMTRLPIRELQEALDTHASLHPERAKLSDFRAPKVVADWEMRLSRRPKDCDATCGNRRAVRNRAVKLNWQGPGRGNQAYHQVRDGLRFPAPRWPAKDVTNCAKQRGCSMWKSFRWAAKSKPNSSGQAFERGVKIPRTGSPASPPWFSLPLWNLRRGACWRHSRPACR